MAGRHHHHIWQMLQRGFSRQEHGSHHIWIYTKNNPPKKTTTKKHGQDLHFYGEQDSLADANITEFENSIQSFVQETRRAPSGCSLDSKLCAFLVAHLEMRSRFARREILRVSDRALVELSQHFSSRKRAAKFLALGMKHKPEIIDEAFHKAGILPQHRKWLKEIIETSPAKILAGASEDLFKSASNSLKALISSLHETTVTAHNKALESDFRSGARSERHARLCYTAHRLDGDDFILPDTCLAVFTRNGCTPMSQKDDRVEAVLAPISSRVAIVGTRDRNFLLNSSTAQRALASCSFESFIAPDATLALDRLTARIGRNAQLLKDSEIKRMASLSSLFDA